MIDSYAYRALVWGIYVESVSKPKRGETADLDRIAKAVPIAETCLAELSRLKRDGAWLLGNDITLADLFLAPVLAYFTQADLAVGNITARATVSRARSTPSAVRPSGSTTIRSGWRSASTRRRQPESSPHSSSAAKRRATAALPTLPGPTKR